MKSSTDKRIPRTLFCLHEPDLGIGNVCGEGPGQRCAGVAHAGIGNASAKQTSREVIV